MLLCIRFGVIVYTFYFIVISINERQSANRIGSTDWCFDSLFWLNIFFKLPILRRIEFQLQHFFRFFLNSIRANKICLTNHWQWLIGIDKVTHFFEFNQHEEFRTNLRNYLNFTKKVVNIWFQQIILIRCHNTKRNLVKTPWWKYVCMHNSYIYEYNVCTCVYSIHVYHVEFARYN